MAGRCGLEVALVVSAHVPLTKSGSRPHREGPCGTRAGWAPGKKRKSVVNGPLISGTVHPEPGGSHA